jgi:hypothetical protein
MHTRVRIFTMMLCLALLVSLTLACSLPGIPGLSGPTTEEDTPSAPMEETPVDEPRCGDGVCDASENAESCAEDCEAAEVETPAPAPEDTPPFGLDVEALEGLTSYAYTFHIDGLSTMEGGAEKVVLDIEGKRQSAPTQAEHLKFSSTSNGDTTAMEVIYIEDVGKMWMREGTDAWQEMPVMDESMLQIFDAFSMFYWWDTIFVGDPEDVQYLGQEMMNGVASHHYKGADSASWGAFATGCSFASVQDEIWVAVDGNYPVKRELNAEADCQGESGTFSFLMEIQSVNQPLDISPPM